MTMQHPGAKVGPTGTYDQPTVNIPAWFGGGPIRIGPARPQFGGRQSPCRVRWQWRGLLSYRCPLSPPMVKRFVSAHSRKHQEPARPQVMQSVPAHHPSQPIA